MLINVVGDKWGQCGRQNTKRKQHRMKKFGLLLSVLLLVSCAPTPTPMEVTPTASPIPPTATPIPPTLTPVPPTATPVIYVVEAGDTLSAIAKEFGVTVEALQEANAISDPRLLQVGQELTIPEGEAVITATATRAEPTPTPIPPSATPPHVQAQVVRVIDGDTIEVSMGGELYKVRYIGIDTPETKHPEKPVEWMGQEASTKNEGLVGGKIVELEKDVSETDRYGRLLRYVWVGDLMVNAELVRLGYAAVSTYPPDVKYQDLFLRLQKEAREAGVGLWAPTPTSLPPTQPPSVAIPLPPTPTQPTPTQPRPPGMGNVVISYIFYDGVVMQVESDEYAQITNNGSAPVNLKGWRLNAGDPGQDFGFPDFVIEPGQSCRVYTNEHHPESCGFSFGSGRAIWNNKGDCGYLYDATGAMVSEYCY